GHPVLDDQLLVEEGVLLHVADELHRRLGQRLQVEALRALSCLVKEHLEREDRFARAPLSGDHVDRSVRQSASENAIEGGAARREALEASLMGAQFASSA